MKKLLMVMVLGASAVVASAQGLQPRRTLGSRLARPAACAVQGEGSCGTESATEKTRKAVAELFPGWSLDTEVANHDWAGIQACYRGQTNVVFIHPVNRATPAIVSRTVILSDKNPCLHLKVASHSEDHDFGLSVRVDGKDALPRRRICTQDFAPWEDVFVPLSKWRGGMAKIEIVLTGINRWTCEFPYFACIEICEGTGDTRIDCKATVDGYAWSYRVNNGEAMIVAETDGQMTCAVSPSPIGHITIPETLDGVKVTGIGYNAFCDCSGITSVTIPSTVKIIGRGAFARCRGLTSLTIPDGVVDIGRESFLGCTGLASVTIPDSVKGIWRNAFRGCAGLTSLAIPSGVTNIEGEAFRGCCALTEVTISSTVTNIDGTAFCDCSALTAVHVDDGNWFYDGNQFYKSENGLLLTKDGTTLVRGVMGDVTVPSSVTNIGSCAFEGCCALRSIQIPSSVKVIGPYAFRNCKGLASVMIPEGVTGIGHDAFHGCSGLESVTLPKGVEIICNSAFTGTALTSVEIPSGVKTLERGAFSWCGGLKSVTIPESVTSIGRDVFYNCGALESVNIPTGVTSIGQGAFCGCNGLSSVEIPETVAKIDQQAFLNCRGLKSVTMRGSCPASPNNVFEGCGNLKTIHVPANSKSWAGLKEWQGKTLALDGPKMSDEQLAKESEQQAKSEQTQKKDPPRPLRGSLRARRLQRQQQAMAEAAKLQAEQAAREAERQAQAEQEKAQREAERAEQRQQLLKIQEELKRVKEAKAAEAGAKSVKEAAQNRTSMVGAMAGTNGLYCVIDISGGSSAERYPVSYLDAVPKGGWTDEYKTTKIVLRRIDAGTWPMMGGGVVTFTMPFYIGVFELTQKQVKLMSGMPDRKFVFEGDMRPADCLSWEEMRGKDEEFDYPRTKEVASDSIIGRLRAKTGISRIDLQTSYQFGCAWNAGTDGKGRDVRLTGRHHSNQRDGKGGYNSRHTVVGSYPPNEWGIYDLHGNVWEICLDRLGLRSSEIDPEGPVGGERRRNLLGGCWNSADGFIFAKDYVPSTKPKTKDIVDDSGKCGYRIVINSHQAKITEGQAQSGQEKSRTDPTQANADLTINKPTQGVDVVAQKLKSCDFLLNKDFKKNAKFYLCLFSASWCGPCRREMPRIAKTYAETLKDDPDIELIHFSRDQNDEKALAWAKEHDVKFPVVKPKGGNPLDLHCNGIPHLFIVKADGTLLEEGHPMRIFNEEKFRELKSNK